MTTPTLIHESDKVVEECAVFSGTNVPVSEMFRCLEYAHNLEVFLHEFPTVSREQAIEEFGKRVRADIDSVVHSDENRVSGWPVFKGTRLPVKNLFDYLAGGYSLDVFLGHFPSANKEQAIMALDAARRALESQAYESATR